MEGRYTIIFSSAVIISTLSFSSVNLASTLTPTTWYFVNIKTSSLNKLKRYVAVKINATSTKRRRRRNINSNNLIQNVVIGTEVGCEKKTGEREACNGPLNSNTQYR